MKTSPTTENALRSLKLEDYDEIVFDPNNSINISDEKDDESGDAANRVKRESEDLKEDTTTVESSMHTTIPEDEKEEASNNHVVTISPMLQPPQNPSQESFSTTPHALDESNKFQYPYPPSRNPNAQYISITHKPTSLPSSYLPIQQSYQPQPVKNYYDFIPSQPDFHYNSNYLPMCSNYRFTPIVSNNAWQIYPQRWK